MTNDQGLSTRAAMTKQIRNPKSEWNRLRVLFVLRHSSFFRHSCLVIRHCAGVWLLLLAARCSADVFLLPTANHSLYEPGQEEKFFVPTPGKPWTSGTFGCVRT